MVNSQHKPATADSVNTGYSWANQVSSNISDDAFVTLMDLIDLGQGQAVFRTSIQKIASKVSGRHSFFKQTERDFQELQNRGLIVYRQGQNTPFEPGRPFDMEICFVLNLNHGQPVANFVDYGLGHGLACPGLYVA